MPGFPVRHQLPELAQTHVRWVGDAIQPPHPLSKNIHKYTASALETLLIPLWVFLVAVVYRLIDSFQLYRVLVAALRVWTAARGICIVSWEIFCHGAQTLWLWGMSSVVETCGLGCATACGNLVPWPGIQSVSLALQGGLLNHQGTPSSTHFFGQRSWKKIFWWKQYMGEEIIYQLPGHLVFYQKKSLARQAWTMTCIFN